VRMEDVIRRAGRVPRQRTTLYGEPDASQVLKSFQCCTPPDISTDMSGGGERSNRKLEQMIFAKPGEKLVS
jgi:hypothetical protein